MVDRRLDLFVVVVVVSALSSSAGDKPWVCVEAPGKASTGVDGDEMLRILAASSSADIAVVRKQGQNEF